MSKQCVTIHPYFEVAEGKLEEFKAIWKAMVPIVQNEEKCQFYEFSVKGNTIFCREGYDDAEGVLTHVGNVGGALQQVRNRPFTAHLCWT
jgi:quinol monooxygenase YgiN